MSTDGCRKWRKRRCAVVAAAALLQSSRALSVAPPGVLTARRGSCVARPSPTYHYAALRMSDTIDSEQRTSDVREGASFNRNGARGDGGGGGGGGGWNSESQANNALLTLTGPKELVRIGGGMPTDRSRSWADRGGGGGGGGRDGGGFRGGNDARRTGGGGGPGGPRGGPGGDRNGPRPFSRNGNGGGGGSGTATLDGGANGNRGGSWGGGGDTSVLGGRGAGTGDKKRFFRDDKPKYTAPEEDKPRGGRALADRERRQRPMVDDDDWQEAVVPGVATELDDADDSDDDDGSEAAAEAAARPPPDLLQMPTLPSIPGRGGGRGGGRRGGGRGGRGRRGGASSAYRRLPPKPETIVRLPEATVTVAQLAERMEAKPAEVVKYLMMDLGIMATVTQSIDAETAAGVARAFGLKVEFAPGSSENDDDDPDMAAALAQISSRRQAIDEDPVESLRPRPPVVTIMGHVDHGKTSLLDAIRKAKVKVAAGEAGGITQHIGAYQVMTDAGNLVTFIDTPGHAAFSEMRARGANATDVVVLVVAADDGVMEQTKESIATAKLAGVPIVVAINKMDKPEADPLRVQNELMQYDILGEEFGGDVLTAKVSAKMGSGINELLEKILLQAEVLDLKANPDRAAEGVVIEARVERGLGAIATTLIGRGTLRIGDIFVAGESWGRVRALLDVSGNRVTQAGPATPVQVVGSNGVPGAGDIFQVVDREDTARDLADARMKLARESEASARQGSLRGNVQDILSGASNADGIEKLELPVLIKADVQGSAEALASALRELVSEDEYFRVNCKILGASVGEVSKSDIAIAGVSDALVVGFNVGANFQAAEDARRDGIEIGYYSIVYDVLDVVQKKLDEIRSPTPEGEYKGKAEVKQIFNIGKVGNIAGCVVLDGVVKKGTNVRVMRMGRVQHEGKLKTLKNVKQDVEEMGAGTECGIQVQGFEEFQEGDSIECYIVD